MLKKILPAGHNEGQSPFMEALKENHVSDFLFKQFVLAENDLNRRDAHGRTVLMYLVTFQVPGEDRIALLREYGADINAKDKDGNTALHYHVKSDWFNEGTTRALLANDADPLAMNKMGKIPFKLANERILKYYGAPYQVLEEATKAAQEIRNNAIAHQLINLQLDHNFRLGTYLAEERTTTNKVASWDRAREILRAYCNEKS